ncbi:MAG: protein kinase [Acidobacteria bacterium]|nr:protein kinase [Acidobacteriota bacterium]
MKRLGRYEILEELGQGAMGTVYRARDPRIDRIVALKTIKVIAASPAEAEEYRQRFLREAQAAGKLSHPGIVTVYDAGEEETTATPYIVMEHIGGRTLESLLAAQGGERLPVETALELAQQLAEALAYAHAQGIIHRDIKPANILVTPEGRAKITDFGIAKLALAQATLPGQILGTPSFMSPEQVSGDAVDGRSDLFSLGVILYWLLTGDKPFTGDTTTAVSFKIVYKDPVPASQLNPALGPHVDYMLDRALAKNPDQRYQNGRELAADLDDLRHDRAPRSAAHAGPVPGIDRTTLRQPARRAAPPDATLPLAAAPPLPAPARRRWVAPALLLLALLLGGVAGWWWVGRGQSAPGPPTRAEQAAIQSLPQSQARSGTTPSARETPSSGRADTSQETTAQAQPDPVEAQEPAPPKKGGPPPWAPAAGRRQAEPEPETAPAPVAILNVRSEHNFRRAEVSVWIENNLAYRGTLRGDKRDYGIATVYQGTFRTQLHLTPGWHNITVRVSSRDDEGFDQTRETQREFAQDRPRTLELDFGKAGFLGNVARNLTLQWKD